jgi:glycogen(starch) synthase
VVEHNQTGLTAYAEDVRSLAWAIVRVLQDPQAANARAQRAQEYVETCLAWPVIAGMTLEVYEAVGRGQ